MRQRHGRSRAGGIRSTGDGLSLDHCRLAVQAVTQGVIVYDGEGQIVAVNPAAESITGMKSEQMIGRRYDGSAPWPVVATDGRTVPADELPIARCLRTGQPSNIDAIQVGEPGRRRWISVDTHPVGDADPDTGVVRHVDAVVTVITDVTDERAAMTAVTHMERRWRAALDNAPVGVLLAEPDGATVLVNAAVTRMLGLSEDELLGRNFIDVTHPDDREITAQRASAVLAGAADSYELEKRYIAKDGHVVWVSVVATLMRHADGSPYQWVTTLADHTERRAVQERLERMSLIDAITGLPNRVILMDRLERTLLRAHRSDHKIVLVCCDIDRFMAVNSSVGRDVGDRVLAEVGRRFVGVLAPTDTVARFGGDEFVILAESARSEDDATALAARLAAALQEPVVVGDYTVTLSVSVGATLVDSTVAPADAIREAETALQAAKLKGRARAEIFDASQRGMTAIDRLAIVNELRRALERDEFVLHYQPVVDLSTGAVVGREALIRWRHPERGLLMPGDFLTIAEDSALIVPIGEWVLRRATHDAASWGSTGQTPPPWVSVNVSAQQLGRGLLVSAVDHALTSSGLSAARLRLEVTETALFAGADAALLELRQADGLGVGIALDDFGTGYSSLTLLRDMPVSVVKLDRSFVSNLGRDAGSTAIVDAMVALAEALALGTVAEGVETESQAFMLRRFGCPLAQGYLFGRPEELQAQPPG